MALVQDAGCLSLWCFLLVLKLNKQTIRFWGKSHFRELMVRIAWPRCLQARLELLHRLWEKIERRVVKYVIPPLLEREERMRLERLRMLAVEESNLALKRVRLEVEELISTRVDNDCTSLPSSGS